MRNVNKLFYTTVALTITNFLMRTVAVWFNVYLADLVGSAGMGIFQLILSVYVMAKTLSYGGMNLAATRLCIDDPEHLRHNMRGMILTSGILGMIGLILLYTLSDTISILWIASDKADLSLKILSFSLPFVALSAALNGYMTAARKMGRYSFIQLFEQIVKIALTVTIMNRVGNLGTEISIAIVCFAITISEVASFSLALLYFILDMRRCQANKKGKRFFKKMSRLAVPDALGAYVRSAFNTIEHLLIPRGIRSSGASPEKAFSDYGTVQGMALPVLLYPSSILGVVSGLLVPEIAECKLKKNAVQYNYIINRVLHVAMIFSMITMSVMLLFAKELSLAIYHSEDAAFFIRLIAPLVPIMYLDMTSDGMLKGLDEQLNIMKINVLDSVLCVILVWFLVPKIAVDGYIVTIYVAEIINFLFSFSLLCRRSKLNFLPFKNFLAPLFCSLSATAISRPLLEKIKEPTPGLILSVSVGILFYFIFLRLSRAISKEDIKWFRSVIKL